MKVSYYKGKYSLLSDAVTAKLIEAVKLPETTYAVTGKSATLSCILAADRQASVNW